VLYSGAQSTEQPENTEGHGAERQQETQSDTVHSTQTGERIKVNSPHKVRDCKGEDRTAGHQHGCQHGCPQDTNMDAHRDAHMDAHMDAHLDYNNSILNFLSSTCRPTPLGGDCRGRNYPLTPLLSTFHILLLYTYSVQWCCMQMFHEKPIKVQGSTSPQTLG
jgi:hypothetical protein